MRFFRVLLTGNKGVYMDKFDALLRRVRSLRACGLSLVEARDTVMSSREPAPEDMFFLAWVGARALDGDE